MRPTTLSKFEVNVLQPFVNLGIITENAANHGVAAIVAAPEHVGALIVQRGMMRASHKVICALDFQNKFFGLDKLTRLKINPLGVDGYEIMLSANRTSIELNNEIRVLTSFIRGNSPRSEVRWILTLSGRIESEITEVMKHLAQHPPTVIRLEGFAQDKFTTAAEVQEAVNFIRKFSNAPIKINATSPELVKSVLGNRDIKAFDIPDSKLLEMSKLVQTWDAFPAAKKPVGQFTVEDFDIVVANLKKQDPGTITVEQLSEYVSRCKVLGPQAANQLVYLEDVLLVKALAGAKEVT